MEQTQKRLSVGRAANVVLLVGGCVLDELDYSFRQHGRAPLFSTSAAAFQTCVILQLIAAGCGLVAMKRGSKAWLVPASLSVLFAIACYFGEL